jgi:glycine oxidase
MTPAPPPSARTSDVAVIGAGVIGLAVAWRLAQAGAAVTVFDPDPERGAWRVAAGMLAPVTEVHYGEESLLQLNLESARRYAPFCSELEELTGQSCGYRPCGTLAVAADNDDLTALVAIQEFQERLGLEVARLSRRECRAMVPSLSPGIRGGVHVAGDHQVDPRRLHTALRIACERAGVRWVAEAVVELAAHRSGALVRSADDSHATGTAIVAGGAWSSMLAGPAVPVSVRPVRGQVLRLHAAVPELLALNVRGLVAGRAVYLVPRSDGEIVVGATAEEKGFDHRVTAGATYELLRDSSTVVPELYELELKEVSVGFRPATPDNAPLIGPSGTDGVLLATGHYRNGVLLAPITADAIAELVANGELPRYAAPFTPLRFGDRAA